MPAAAPDRRALEPLRTLVAAVKAAAEAEAGTLAGACGDLVPEARRAVAALGAELADAERDLEAARRAVAKAERRARIAHELQDSDTGAIATRLATRARERAASLETSLALVRAECARARDQLRDTLARLAALRQLPTNPAEASALRAWTALRGRGPRAAEPLDPELADPSLTTLDLRPREPARSPTTE